MFLIKDICNRCNVITQEIEVENIPARGALTCLVCPSSSTRLIIDLENNEIIDNSEFVSNTIVPILRKMRNTLKEKEEQRKNFIYIPQISDDCHYEVHSLCKNYKCPCDCHSSELNLCKKCRINSYDLHLSISLNVDSWCSQCIEEEKWDEIQSKLANIRAKYQQKTKV